MPTPTPPGPAHPHRGAPSPEADRQLPAHLREALHHVLAGLAYPAQRWQILAHAAYWGASPAFCAVLAHLPERTYHSHGAVHLGLRPSPSGPAATASTSTPGPVPHLMSTMESE